MLVADSFEIAQTYSEQAFALMLEKGIASTPPNFTIWYDYFSEKNLELKQAIDKILSSQKEITQETCSELYQKFYLTDDTQSEHIQEAGDKIQETLQEVIQQISNAGSDNATFGNKITSLANDISGENNAASLKNFVKEIVRETAVITEKNKILQNQLSKSSNEIDTLQQNLEKVKTESLTDALTQIGNRKMFDNNLLKDSRHAEEEGTDLCLLLMDIDHFKKFNDTYGHRVGDEVLKVVAKKLKSAVKGQDTPARYGGEEFTCILPNTSLHDAASLADQIREKIAKQVLKNKKTGKEFGRITLSVGVAKYIHGEPLEGFIQRADEALYRAKDQGRNRVIKEIT